MGRKEEPGDFRLTFSNGRAPGTSSVLLASKVNI